MITKKEIMNLLKEFKEGTPFDWKIHHCVVLVQGEEMRIAIDYVGQGMDCDIYNKNYDKYIDIKDKFMDYKGLGGEYNLQETTNRIYEFVKIEMDI
ncbi:hypothetical protein [Clostridium baratii]|uniref:Uncharacterized protein n=1 Tax=Clostridium baratii TaxID=1561 RepID=A0A174VEP1_9CLOT|nr:hypothetical protein [Clostridium baratii]CUQ30485.1 Uncharacterised protein [Clostridium baratii]